MSMNMSLSKTRFLLIALLTPTICGAATDATGRKAVRLALQTEPPQLDARKATDAQSFFVLGHTMEGLTRYGKAGEIVPGVAEKWELNDKGAVFHLRKNAQWSDGKPVTAKDFVFAWRSVVDPKLASEYAFILYPLKNAEQINKGQLAPTELGVVATDDHTLKITFEKPCGYFLGLTAFATYFPAREDFVAARKDKYAADAGDLLSDGAFILTKWVHGSELHMEKNPHYWNKEKVALDAIDIPYITPDNSAQFNFFKDGKVDLIERLNKDDLPKAQAERFKMKNFAEGTVFFMEFNFREGRTTRSKSLRKAIQLVFNVDEYVSKVVGIPGTKPGHTLIPTWLKGVKETFRKEFPVAPVRMNIAEAKKLVEQAKKELGVAQLPALVWLTGDTPFAAKEAEYFQNLLKTNLGLDIRIDKQIFKQRLAKMTAGDFDIVAAGWGPDYADPMTYADLMTSWNENNRGKYENPAYDKLIREAQATANPKLRMEAMAKAEKIALDDLAVLPTYERAVVFLNSDRVQNVVRHTIGPDPDFNFASITQ